jgi:hypothetical protein
LRRMHDASLRNEGWEVKPGLAMAILALLGGEEGLVPSLEAGWWLPPTLWATDGYAWAERLRLVGIQEA